MPHRDSTSPPEPASNDHDELFYDSFVIRLWHHRGQTAFSRAEVRHVQTDQSSTDSHVRPGWILQAIVQALDRDQATETSTTSGPSSTIDIA